MFNEKKAILLITKDYLKASSVGPKESKTNSHEYEWNQQTLKQRLFEIKDIFGSSFRLVLSDEFTYLVNIYTQGDEVNKESIKEKAAEIIPDSLDETLWGYRSVNLSGSGGQLVQVVALVKDFYQLLTKNFTGVNLNIEYMEPLSFSLCKELGVGSQDVVLICNKPIRMMVFVSHGVVLATELIEDEVSKETVDTFIDFVKNKFEVSPTGIIFANFPKSFNVNSFKEEGLEVSEKSLDGTSGLINIKDINGEKILDVSVFKSKNSVGITEEKQPTENQPQPVEDEKEDQKKELPSFMASSPMRGFSHLDKEKKTPVRLPKPLVIALVCLALLLGFGFAGYRWLFSNSVEEPQSQESVSNQTISSASSEVSSSAQSQASEEAKPADSASKSAQSSESAKLDLTKYKIRVLNGNGLPGSANKLAQTLKDSGYDVIGTGNASNYNFGKTEVRYKESVTQDFKDALDNILKNIYDISVGSNLDPKTDSDLTVTVGKN